MTTELEEKFYKTFGISKREFCDCNSDGFCPSARYEVCDNSCVHWIKQIRYPKITDHILLELVCILSKAMNSIDCSYNVLANDISELKEKTLKHCIMCQNNNYYDIKSDIRRLFEE